MNRRLGFSLSELIIVVAILAVLAALLFPVLREARSRALLVQDISNMRQLYVAIDLYNQDNANELPPSLLSVEPYAKSHSVFVSPMDPYRNGVPGVADFPANMLDGSNLRSPFRISYAYLVPMAMWEGWDRDWIRARWDDPTYSVLAISMYNDLSPYVVARTQCDLNRWQKTEYRLRTDGSYEAELNAQAGVNWSCDVRGCFGPVEGPADSGHEPGPGDLGCALLPK